MLFGKPKPSPVEVFHGLREQAFTIPPDQVGVTPGPGHQRVWTVFMETGYAAAVVSLVVIADGTTSLYFSKGGGILGGGQHATVRKASLLMIALADSKVDLLAVADSHPLPEVGRVRFYARTFDELRMAEADEKELVAKKHPLSVLFYAGHQVIAAVRQATPQGGPAGQKSP